MISDLGTVYRIWQSDQTSVTVSPEEQSQVDRALKLWTEQRRDTWLSLTGDCGVEVCLLASTVTAASKTTADQRREVTLRDKELEDERAEFRRLAGYIESQ